MPQGPVFPGVAGIGTFLGQVGTPTTRNRACEMVSAQREIPTDRLSFVVGVTGHRDIASDDEPALRAAFGNVLDQLELACPHTPLLVLSGLAAGADTLAAEEAIERGIPVYACLPMPVDEYEKDFSPPELLRFRTLLAGCARTTVTSQVREHGYLATGRFITQYCHLLVAFWDGATSRGAGGTADVINMRLTGETQFSGVDRIPYLPDIGPVDHIATPRLSGPRPVVPFMTQRLFPKSFRRRDDAKRTFQSLLAHIDTYNVDLAKTPADGEPQLQTLMNRTDAAANRLQKWTNFFQQVLFVSAFLVAMVQVISHVPLSWKVFGLFGTACVYLLARVFDYENRYQDYRAIAEGLRVQTAWYCAGLKHRLVDREYLRMQEGELQWIRMALRFFYLIYCEVGLYPDASHEHLLCKAWLRSQWRYYYGASRREAACKDVLDRITWAAIAVGVTCTAASLIVLYSERLLPCALFESCPSPSTALYWLTNLVTVPIVMAALLGALFTHYAEKQNLSGNARRYDRMFYVFDRARRTLLRYAQGTPGDPQEVIYQLGRAALVEHADWLIMHRDHPMRIVQV
jgi:hypothetical protein